MTVSIAASGPVLSALYTLLTDPSIHLWGNGATTTTINWSRLGRADGVAGRAKPFLDLMSLNGNRETLASLFTEEEMRLRGEVGSPGFRVTKS
jgi:hypothetical protein